MKILLVEDDARMADYTADGLSQAGHVVDVARTGRDGLFMAASGSHDVIIVDRMLPGMDGLALVKVARGAGLTTPVLFLTTMGGINDRVEGLEAGGDDYLVKPFAFAELAARVAALVRRPPLSAHPSVLRIADLDIDCAKRTVARRGVLIPLQPREFRLLEFLARREGQVVTKTMLLEQVWDFHFDPQTSVVETHMSRLRAKMDRDFPPELIHTIRGAGYVLRAPG
ncbi:winged helix-turn-helix domain-containing protein [Lichenibacterium dinghuense]|jgi:two-component system OmpR family response regulator|uniref:winged helix-turn-helix domain-containing protein n=1 Tax=Lichenibacterium dinghuense TaxID=2895977 RepID=UPI001EFFFF5E|nr:winged helix-turn-helix domain-containing protein [Lichenibacterium sp. 6Y81]